MSVVIIGGTSEARQLAERLTGDGCDVWTSLAGATASPRALPGRVQTGGFGSDAATAAWLREVGATAVVDATHPFAARMTARMARLAATTGVPVLRLDRPGWGERPDAATWTWVGSHAEATREADVDLPGRVLLAVGRQEAEQYAGLTRPAVLRVVSDPDVALPPSMRVVRARGPFDIASEREFFAAHDVALLVTKDAGGAGSSAKLDVAAERGTRVVMVARPAVPAGLATVPSVAAAADWVASVTS